MHGEMQATAQLDQMPMLIVNENIASLFGTVGDTVCYMTTGIVIGCHWFGFQSEARTAART